MERRRSGILLHPLSLPGPAGCGDFGSASETFLDQLAAAGQTLWQMLPLGPTGYADSPYACLSSMAGSPLLIGFEPLIQIGLLSQGDLRPPNLPVDTIDYDAVRAYKGAVLERAFQSLMDQPLHPWRVEFERFYTDEGWWLHDYALFMTLRDLHGNACWNQWPREQARRDPAALDALNREHQELILRHKFHQFLFFRQLGELRAKAAARGILLVGDMPIFVAFDSADAWAWRHYFRIDELGRPVVVAGVPPDYFSATGQLWGNPHYDWPSMRMDDWWWWRSRFHMLMRQADVIRVDHFRGFEACWEIPGGAATAQKGEWVKTPGRELFTALRHHLPDLKLIAEDLGLITAEVEALRKDFDMPGMKILQFAFFTDSRDPFLPHNHEPACVAYTGTHDNNTLRGFFEEEATPEQQAWMRRYLGMATDDELLPRSLDVLWRSCARWVLAPMQDLLDLGAGARINTPGTTEGNWCWRLAPGTDWTRLTTELRELNGLANRNLPPRAQR